MRSAATPAPAEGPAPPTVEGGSPFSSSAWKRFVAVAKPFWLGDKKRLAWGFLAMLLVLMAAETQFAVMLNTQSGEVASALAAKDGTRFWHAVWMTLGILAFAVPAYSIYYYARDVYSNHWRRWLTQRFLDGYLKDQTYFALNNHEEVDNPDQRISEDINTFTGRSLHFLLIFIGSAMQLVAFSAVLWGISPLLVGVMAVYAVAGTAIAMLVFGAPLIRLNFLQLRREADFRFRLMRVRENAESIAFYRGEPQERQQLDRRFRGVFRNYSRLIRTQLTLNLFQRGFSQISTLIPFVVLAPQVLSGDIEMGKAVAAGGAFAAVLGAVSLIVDNFESLSRFVAGIDRLHDLAMHVAPDAAAATAPTAAPASRAARIRRHVGRTLSARGLTVRAPGSERMLVKDLNFQLAPGESLMITGASGSGKSSILRAVAGLWGSGSGQIEHPPPEEVFFLPQRPYLQKGTLRSQLIYPSTTSKRSDDELLQILRDVRLPDLADRVGGLDAVADWEKRLSGGEQQRLAFARVLVHEPHMAILDEATSALDEDNEQTLYQRLRERGTTLVSIAHRQTVQRFHDRLLRLKGGGEWELKKGDSAE